MPWTRTDIANVALTFMGLKGVSDIDTDTGADAKAIREIMDLAIDDFMGEAPWPMGTKVAELSLVEELDDDENAEWDYSYRYPSDCVRLIRVRSEAREDNRYASEQNSIEYKIESDTSGRLILSDEEDAEAEYVYIPEEGLFPGKAIHALALSIAKMAAPRIKQAASAAQQFVSQYEAALNNAKVLAANEGQHLRPQDPPAIRARRGMTRPGGEVNL